MLWRRVRSVVLAAGVLRIHHLSQICRRRLAHALLRIRPLLVSLSASRDACRRRQFLAAVSLRLVGCLVRWPFSHCASRHFVSSFPLPPCHLAGFRRSRLHRPRPVHRLVFFLFQLTADSQHRPTLPSISISPPSHVTPRPAQFQRSSTRLIGGLNRNQKFNKPKKLKPIARHIILALSPRRSSQTWSTHEPEIWFDSDSGIFYFKVND